MKIIYFKQTLTAFLLLFLVSAEASVIYRTTESGTPGVVFELTFLDTVASSSTAWALPDDNISDVLVGGISGFRADFGDGNGWLTATTGDLPKSYLGAMFSYYGTSIDGGQFYPGDSNSGVTFSNGFVIGTPTLAWDHSWYSDGTNHKIAGAFAYELFTSVPEPGVVWLFGTGLLGLIGMARRKQSKNS